MCGPHSARSLCRDAPVVVQPGSCSGGDVLLPLALPLAGQADAHGRQIGLLPLGQGGVCGEGQLRLAGRVRQRQRVLAEQLLRRAQSVLQALLEALDIRVACGAYMPQPQQHAEGACNPGEGAHR